MLKYINEEEYKKLLGVESIPDDFNKLVIEASSYINRHTFGRIDENNIPEEVKYTTCLIVDEINKYNERAKSIGNVKSENVSKWSKTYKDANELQTESQKNKINILSEILYDVVDKEGTPLLFRGDKYV